MSQENADALFIWARIVMAGAVVDTEPCLSNQEIDQAILNIIHNIRGNRVPTSPMTVKDKRLFIEGVLKRAHEIAVLRGLS